MVNKKIQLDFTEEGLREKIEVVQGDTGRVLVCNIIGVDMTNVSARFYAVKESGKEIYNNCTVSQNTVTIELTEQTLAEVGIVKCQLDLRKGDQKVQSFIFDIDVTASLMAQSEYLSSDEYKVVDDLADKVEKNENKIAELDDKKANKDDYGSPLKAKTVAEMTDKKKVYVYVGTETGYINGNWYTWEETAWVSGGVYNSAAIQTDKTLKQPDKAADSAIVGQQIGSLKESIKNATVTDGSITTEKIKDGAVTYDKLGIVKKQSQDTGESLPKNNKNLLEIDGGNFYVNASTIPNILYSIWITNYKGTTVRDIYFYTRDNRSVYTKVQGTKVEELGDIGVAKGVIVYKYDITELKEIAKTINPYSNLKQGLIYIGGNNRNLNTIDTNVYTKPYACNMKPTNDSLSAYFNGEMYTEGQGGNENPSVDDMSDINSDFISLIQRIIKNTDLTDNIPETSYKVQMPHYGELAVLFGDSNMQFWTAHTPTPTTCFNAVGMGNISFATSGAKWYDESETYADSRNGTQSLMGQLDKLKEKYPTPNDCPNKMLYILLFGTNDGETGGYEAKAGEKNLVGAMRYSLNALLEYDPAANIIGLIPTRRYDSNLGIAYSLMGEKTEVIKKVYDDYSIPYLDLYNDSNIRRNEINTSDNVHLTDDGYKKLTSILRSFINTH